MLLLVTITQDCKMIMIYSLKNSLIWWNFWKIRLAVNKIFPPMAQELHMYNLVGKNTNFLEISVLTNIWQQNLSERPLIKSPTNPAVLPTRTEPANTFQLKWATVQHLVCKSISLYFLVFFKDIFICIHDNRNWKDYL